MDEWTLELHIQDAYHGANEVQITWVSFLYSLLCVIGIVGNLAVLTGLYKLHKVGNLTVNATIIYLAALCLADLMSALSIPALVMDQLYGAWKLGRAACKVEILLEGVGKVLNSFLLCAMAFDRCAGVAWHRRPALRRNCVARRLVAVLVCVAALLLSPVAIYTRVTNVRLDEPPELLLDDEPNRTDRKANEANNVTLTLLYAVVPRCHFSPTFALASPYLMSCFTVAFLLPLFGSAAFYGRLLWTLVRQARRNRGGRRLPLVRIGTTSILVTLFYFLCFAPYWIVTVVAMHVDVGPTARSNDDGVEHDAKEDEPVTNRFVQTMLLIHWLPLLNCSVNWIFYGIMNRELQRSFCRSTVGQRQHFHTQRSPLLHRGRSQTLMNVRRSPSPGDLDASPARPRALTYCTSVFRKPNASSACNSPTGTAVEKTAGKLATRTNLSPFELCEWQIPL